MTKHYKTIQTETKELHGITCDKCAENIPIDDNNDYTNFELNYAIGKQYPDGGYGDGWCVNDLCDICADKLKNLLLDNGYKVVEYDW